MDELTPIKNATLGELPDTVKVPTYDRSALTPGIVHIGLGNFHRAHQAWYLHRLMQDGLCHDWAILGAGVRPYDSVMREKLVEQDCLTTLIQLDPASTELEVTGGMIDYIPVVDGHKALIDQMSRPEIRIVALTVTEGGYYRVQEAFDADHPDIQADLANPDAPATAFGAIVAALRARHAAGHGPFTIQSCDNLQNNGDIVKDTVISLARLMDRDLADWIETKSSFPNSMVDCIVPATGPNEMALVQAHGIDDQAPVTHEPFRHWVIEDRFCAGRPEWERVGATITDNVHRFEAMKLRILNGGHQVIANIGDLLGIDIISDAAAHPLISALLHKVETEEILPQVEPVPGFTPEAYLNLIEERFANPRIVDTTRRVAFDGSSRHPGFLFASIRDRIAKSASVNGLALVEALWARYCFGTREDGSVIEPNDPIWETLVDRAKAARDTPQVWLEMDEIYGDIAEDAGFADAFSKHLRRIHTDGVSAATTWYLEN